MYQINIPAIYSELADKNMENMKKVLVYGTAGASMLYIIAGMFGLAAFAGYKGEYPMNYNKNPAVRWTFDDIM